MYDVWVEGGKVRRGACSVLARRGEAGGCRWDWRPVVCYSLDALVSR